MGRSADRRLAVRLAASRADLKDCLLAELQSEVEDRVRPPAQDKGGSRYVTLQPPRRRDKGGAPAGLATGDGVPAAVKMPRIGAAYQATRFPPLPPAARSCGCVQQGLRKCSDLEADGAARRNRLRDAGGSAPIYLPGEHDALRAAPRGDACVEARAADTCRAFQAALARLAAGQTTGARWYTRLTGCADCATRAQPRLCAPPSFMHMKATPLMTWRRGSSGVGHMLAHRRRRSVLARIHLRRACRMLVRLRGGSTWRCNPRTTRGAAQRSAAAAATGCGAVHPPQHAAQRLAGRCIQPGARAAAWAAAAVPAKRRRRRSARTACASNACRRLLAAGP